ncbi:hypothetical protein LZ32DRAFT_597510 [Colletotrichum eremochloae]|nr:hypothetical protein LZ32DRAFT_597510 [Colletotrichum eremochloae]
MRELCLADARLSIPIKNFVCMGEHGNREFGSRWIRTIPGRTSFGEKFVPVNCGRG